MGGEPTFVSIDDMDGDGMDDRRGRTDEARASADALIRRLRDRFAPGGLLHYGQGKWYPGESLPRWAFALYWRGDGVPLVERCRAHRARGRRSRSRRSRMPPRSLAGIAQRIDVDPVVRRPRLRRFRHTFVHKEARAAGQCRSRSIPSWTIPKSARGWRARFERGLNTPAAFVLPVQRWNAADVRRLALRALVDALRTLFSSSRATRPSGFRLPLDSLPWLPPSDRPFIAPPDPFAPLPPLPDPHERAAVVRRRPRREIRRGSDSSCVEQEIAIDGSRAHRAVGRTARRAPVRVHAADGTAADYLELLAAVEDAAADLAAPVHIEGYPPPYDPRINVIKVTPDPGVIEVNIHPARNWREAGRDHQRRCTKKRASRASAPRSSCSTAGTPAPAAAITSSSARRRRPTVRSCAGPICSRA